jgi:hypothetical protein
MGVSDPVADLLESAESAGRKYKALSRQHLDLIDQAARYRWTAQSAFGSIEKAIGAAMAQLFRPPVGHPTPGARKRNSAHSTFSVTDGNAIRHFRVAAGVPGHIRVKASPNEGFMSFSW